MNLDDLPIYVAHCKSLVARREVLEQRLSSLGLTATWIIGNDAIDLTPEIINTFYEFNPKIFKLKTSWYCNFKPRRLKLAEISLAIKHLTVYQKLCESGRKVGLVLEDDVLLPDDFRDRISALNASSFDLIFLGDCCDLRIPNPRPDKLLYLKKHPASKCTDSYLISATAAIRLLGTMKPFTLAADFELNHQMMVHNMEVYWCEPPLVSQASGKGLQASTVQ